MYELKKQLLKAGHWLRPGGEYPITSITLHSTANEKSSAQNERDWLDNPQNKRAAAWHYVVGDGVVIQAIPDTEEAWHSGTQAGNRGSIGIEMIESGNRRGVVDTAAEFVADKLREYELGPADVKWHRDWTGKSCPRIFIEKEHIKPGIGWAFFRARLNYYLEQKREEKVVYFQTIESLPEWGRETIQKLVDAKAFADPNLLNLSEDMLRVFVVLDRMGKI